MAEETTVTSEAETPVVAGAEADTTLEAGATTVEGDAAASVAKAVADAEAPWYQSMDEGSHESLKGFDSLDAVLEAAGRGKDFYPAKDVSEFDIKLSDMADGADPEAVKEVVAGYAQVCLDNNVTPASAQAIVDWQEGLARDTEAKVLEIGETALREAWKGDYELNKSQSLVAIQALDKRMDGEVSAALKETGLAKDPRVIKMFHLISTAISEDSLGGASPGAVDLDTEQDPVDGIKKLGFK